MRECTNYGMTMTAEQKTFQVSSVHRQCKFSHEDLESQDSFLVFECVSLSLLMCLFAGVLMCWFEFAGSDVPVQVLD